VVLIREPDDADVIVYVERNSRGETREPAAVADDLPPFDFGDGEPESVPFVFFARRPMLPQHFLFRVLVDQRAVPAFERQGGEIPAEVGYIGEKPGGGGVGSCLR